MKLTRISKIRVNFIDVIFYIHEFALISLTWIS